jgi:hypothetical protein
MSLKSMVKAVKGDLPITVMHEQWLTENPDPVYSQKALDFAALQLAGKSGSQRLRKRMFRASSTNMCTRRQILTFISQPVKREITSTLGNIFATGNFLHLKWQMQGLTAGWLKAAEVPFDVDELRAGGTADGVLHTGGGFEFKSINDRGYGNVMTYGPKEEHEEQADNYMFLGGLDHYSIVYENKNNGEWREFLHKRDDARMLRVAERFDMLNLYLEEKRLPVILPDCKREDGAQFRNCPFRDSCLKIKMWPKAA